MKLGLLGLSTIALSIALAPHAALASGYRTPSSGTFVNLPELPLPPGGQGGAASFYYITSIGGQPWQGYFRPPSVVTSGGTMTYTTKFDDSPVSNPSIHCTGNLVLTRSTIVTSSPMPMTATWTVTGGTSCPTASGTSTTLNLSEAMPQASVGQFTPANSKTIRHLSSPNDLWPIWRPANPNVRCYNSPTLSGPFVALSGNFGAIAINGSVLKVTNGSAVCYVQARITNIRPVSMPY